LHGKHLCHLVGLWALGLSPVSAGETNVAVAANLTAAAKEIETVFKVKTGHDAVLSFGSSGQFYTQITREAPFQVFSLPTPSALQSLSVMD
jgi:molybdate transport system substrate-binding protein